MLRSSLTLAGLVALGAAAQAQQAIPSKAHPITGTVRDAGVFHAATNTWTRKASQANIGADIIYNNTNSTGYFSALSGDTYNDEGRIPSPSSPTNLNSRPGCRTSYNIDGVQIAYCTDQTTATFGTYTVNFFQSYTACATLIGSTPQGTVNLTGPAAPVAGTLQCWVVTVDLAGPGGTPFTMLADGDGTYAGTSPTNLFGWNIKSTATGTSTGPFMACDPNVASIGYDGTRWDSPVNYNEDGNGMGTLDQFRIEGGPTTAGCYFFGGIPFASFHLELYATACGPTTVGTPFCFGDGTGTACPCANNGLPGNGCANSLNTNGANIAGTGVASIANDTVVLTTTNTPNSSVLFFQGTIQQAGGAGGAFGDGKRCAGGTVVRLGTKNAALGVANYPVAGDLSVHLKGLVTAPGTRTYQGWYRNAAAFCTASTFNLTNGLEVAWGL
ncbi:MAG: hypothetical protein NTY35_16335 [Planctomycetota bacterium]|nr:hypothetical protein [Planctomycetota bacterium]